MSDTGITTAKGFKAASVGAGIKYEGRDDMALIFSDLPCTYAAVFTKNAIKAAPVIWDKEVLDKDIPVHAVVINSGIANAATGREGYLACTITAEYAAEKLGIKKNEVLVSSTGVIGMQLPLPKLKSGIDMLKDKLSDSVSSGNDAALAIMTTDTVDKQISVSVNIGGKQINIGGMAKGSGMIHPNMGTMLCFITTDADISRSLLQKALKNAVEDTFNMVTVDGDTSTNDTCMVLANGAAKNVKIEKEDEDYSLFYEALLSALKELAIMIASDGEGATRLIETKVINAKNKNDAKVLAKSVTASSLVKAAVFGHDANWGRILCALGYAGCDINPDKVDITVEGNGLLVTMAKDGGPAEYSEKEATKAFSAEKVTFICDMKDGNASATAWGCDLSYDYVKINADYRS